MCKFFPITPLKAGNFDSEAATDGHVLTADGAGGAAWEAGGGGGGASFVYDGATFTAGDFVAESGARTVEIELTLDGNAITSGTVQFYLAVTNSGNPWGADGYDVNNSDWRIYTWDGIFSVVGMLIGSISAADSHIIISTEIYFTIPGGTLDAIMHILLPNGGVASSDAITIPGVPA